METPTGFEAICALYPVLARVQAEIARNSNAIKIGRHSIQNVETTIIFTFYFNFYLEMLGSP